MVSAHNLDALAGAAASQDPWAAATLHWLAGQHHDAALSLLPSLQTPHTDDSAPGRPPDPLLPLTLCHISRIAPRALPAEQATAHVLARVCTAASTSLETAGLPLLALQALQISQLLLPPAAPPNTDTDPDTGREQQRARQLLEAVTEARASHLAALTALASLYHSSPHTQLLTPASELAAGRAAASMLTQLSAKGLDFDRQAALEGFKSRWRALHHRHRETVSLGDVDGDELGPLVGDLQGTGRLRSQRTSDASSLCMSSRRLAPVFVLIDSLMPQLQGSLPSDCLSDRVVNISFHTVCIWHKAYSSSCPIASACVSRAHCCLSASLLASWESKVKFP